MSAAQPSPPSPPFRVSAVIALYDKRDYVEEALRSIQAQTLQPVEIIVVDDGSTDGSYEAVAALNIPNLMLLRTSHIGPGPARNLGMARASGDYVAFLDADDLWLPHHLETLAEVARACPDAVLLATDYRQFVGLPPSSFDRSGNAPPRRFSFFEESIADSRICVASAAVNRDAALKIGQFGDFIPGEDRYFWQALAFHADAAVVDRVTALYRRQTGGIMEQVTVDDIVPSEAPPHLRQIDQYCANNSEQNIPPGIDAYVRGEWVSALQQYLYRRHVKSAQWALRQMRDRNIAVPAHLAILAMLPQPAVSVVMAAHRLRRRLFAAPVRSTPSANGSVR